MGSDIAIRVEGLGKRYKLGQTIDLRRTFRETVSGLPGFLGRRARRAAAELTRRAATKTSGIHGTAGTEADPETPPGTFWALRDVSFELRQGEVLGVIGRNGAGKSTLLKLLSRITAPTAGLAEIHGRVGSLLEVGTGFHPELTGRENIFLNGAILGMHKVEIDRKFDEIVDFAGVERFLDTPVKRYSSGMYVRLAFAVAAHLEPEVLIVDEVLSVGDAQFQRKCLGKMEEVATTGRTILFVSHSLHSVARLCSRVILLNSGSVEMDGPVLRVLQHYQQGEFGLRSAYEYPNIAEAPGNDIVRLIAIRVRSEDGRLIDQADIRSRIGVEMEFEVLQPGHILLGNFHFQNSAGICLFSTHELNTRWRNSPRPAGRYRSTVWLPGNLLSEGTVVVSAAINTPGVLPVTHVFERDRVCFDVLDPRQGDTAIGEYPGDMPGVLRPLLEWTGQEA